MTEDGYWLIGGRVDQDQFNVGKIASIDRGWLLSYGPLFLVSPPSVGKIASIDRGWLHNGLTARDPISLGWEK